MRVHNSGLCVSFQNTRETISYLSSAPALSQHLPHPFHKENVTSTSHWLTSSPRGSDSLVSMKSLNEASSFWVYTVGVELRYVFIACSSSLQQALSLKLCWNSFHPSPLHFHSLLSSTKSQRREIISCVAPGSYRHSRYYALHACSSVADHTYSTGQLAKNSQDLTNEFHSLATNIWSNSAWYGMQGIWWRLGMLEQYVEQKSLAFQIPAQWFIAP